jgi:carbon storage regulator CsrA
MLVLTRKHQEKIRIGENITITVLKTKGKTVRLGIEAPAEVPVIRGELSFAEKEVESPAEVNVEDTAGSHSIGETSRVDRMRKHWPTEPQESAVRQVTLQRVPREQLRQMLPTTTGGAAPLRTLVERRSVSA